MARPEDDARRQIDAALELAGWAVQDLASMNVDAAPGIAVRDFPLLRALGSADYLLYVGGQVAGVLEAKKALVPFADQVKERRGWAIGDR